MDIETEIMFVIESHKKAKDKELFKTRLKQLFLEGEISSKAFQVAKIIYEIKGDAQKEQKPNDPPRKRQSDDVDPCCRTITRSNGC
jgi:hypothetical protein